MDCNNSSIKNLYNIGFECPVDRGSITVYLTCKNNKCSISEGLYFIVKFEKQIIDDIEYDTRLMFPSTNSDKTLDNFVDRNKIIYNEENYSISFNTGSENIVLNKAKTVNDLKCYVPLSEVIMNKGDCTSNDRCEQIIKEPRPVHIINVSGNAHQIKVQAVPFTLKTIWITLTTSHLKSLYLLNVKHNMVVLFISILFRIVFLLRLQNANSIRIN